MPATRKAVSYKRLLELETQLQVEVEELFALSDQSEQQEALDGLVVSKEIARRQDRLVRLAEAKAVLEARAKERVAAEQVEYEAKLAQREERERTTGRSRGGRPPTPPTEGPRDGDQYNFTDPQSRIMKSSTDEKSYQAKLETYTINPHVKLLVDATDLTNLLNQLTDVDIQALPIYLHLTRITSQTG